MRRTRRHGEHEAWVAVARPPKADLETLVVAAFVPSRQAMALDPAQVLRTQ